MLNPNVKLEQRTKLRSKAANCTVALPQNVAKLITVKEKKNDTMTYIDSRDGDTYTIEYGEIMDEKQAKEFKDILNTYISNVLPYFEIIR